MEKWVMNSKQILASGIKRRRPEDIADN